MTGVTAPAQFANNAARRAAGDLVTPLATATVETWYTAGGTFYVYGRYGWEEYTLNAKTVNVAFDGNDIFLQGLSFYFPESWIKGTINGAHFFFILLQLIRDELRLTDKRIQKTTQL